MSTVEYRTNDGDLFFDDELKLCPFCGTVPIIETAGNNHTRTRSAIVKCKQCNVIMKQTALRMSSWWILKQVIASWNKRVTNI